jgi:hypothetical protein
VDARIERGRELHLLHRREGQHVDPQQTGGSGHGEGQSGSVRAPPGARELEIAPVVGSPELPDVRSVGIHQVEIRHPAVQGANDHLATVRRPKAEVQGREAAHVGDALRAPVRRHEHESNATVDQVDDPEMAAVRGPVLPRVPTQRRGVDAAHVRSVDVRDHQERLGADRADERELRPVRRVPGIAIDVRAVDDRS